MYQPTTNQPTNTPLKIRSGKPSGTNTKKSPARILVNALAITLITAMLLVPLAASAAAPAQPASAAAIKLNKTSASVLVAKSVRLSVSGTKNTVRWSSSNPAVAAVSGGKVTGKKPGKAVITAKVSGRAFKCSVTVKYNAAAAEKNITSETKDLYNGILVQYGNRNKYPVSITATLRYRDAVRTVISETTDQNYCLEAGKSTWLYFPKPTDSAGNYVKYSDYKISIRTNASKYKGCTRDITQWCKAANVTMDVTAYNYSGRNLTAARISCLLYDSRGRVVAYMPYFPSCLQKDSHSEETLNYPPYISSPARVESHVDYAY